MVNAMLVSLEKSKSSLNTLSQDTNSVHFNEQQQPQGHGDQKQRQQQRQGQGQESVPVAPKNGRRYGSDGSDGQNQAKANFDPTKLERYQSILSRVDDLGQSDHFPQKETTIANRGRGAYEADVDEGQAGEDDQRFDPPESDDFDLPFASTTRTEEIHENNDHYHHRHQQQRRNSSAKWRGESIGIDQEMIEEEDDLRSEVSSAMEASDWPPPGRVNKTAPLPKRGFISAEERLRPPPSTATVPLTISQRSISTSRMDTRRGHRGGHSQTMTQSLSSSRSSRDDTHDNSEDSLSSFKKKSLLSTDSRPHAPHYFLKSRHGASSVSTSSGPRATSSSSHVSRKSIHTVRYAKGMPRVVRLCISHGPMIKVRPPCFSHPLPLPRPLMTILSELIWRTAP